MYAVPDPTFDKTVKGPALDAPPLLEIQVGPPT